MSVSNLLSVGDAAIDITLPDDLDHPIRLSELWQQQPIVLVFVRHSGCTFCRAQAVEFRAAYSAIKAIGADVVFVSMDEPGSLHALKKQLLLPFLCLSDPQQEGYRAYQCPRGGLYAVAGPAMWWRAITSLFRHGAGPIQGDPMQLPGTFVIDRSGIIRFVYRSRHSADWASAQDVIQTLKTLSKDKPLPQAGR